MPKLFKTAAEIDGSLRAAGVHVADAMALAASSKPYIWLETSEVDDEAEIALGATKIGGTPDLPATMPWPWRPPYPDHEQRVEAAQAGADLFNSQDMAALQAEPLEEFRKLLPPDECEACAANPQRSITAALISIFWSRVHDGPGSRRRSGSSRRSTWPPSGLRDPSIRTSRARDGFCFFMTPTIGPRAIDRQISRAPG